MQVSYSEVFAAGRYLAVPVSASFLLGRSKRLSLFFSAISIVGTVAHEASHLVVGFLLFAKPQSFDVFPRRSGDTYVLGSVGFANLRWFNAAPTCLAPLLILPLLCLFAILRTGGNWSFSGTDAGIWIAVIALAQGSLPSPTDWRLACRSWPLVAAPFSIFMFGDGHFRLLG